MRKIAMGALVQWRILALAPVSVVTSYITPLAVAIVIISLYGRPTGSLVIGTVTAAMWNTLLLQSLLIISKDRVWGTMELLVATPAGLTSALLGRLIGALAQAVVAIPLTLALSLAAGGVPVLGPWALVLAASVEILAGLAGIAMLHMAMIIRYKSYTAFVNAIFPLSIALMGLFAPIDRMPLGIEVLGRIFAPTWALEAIRTVTWEPLVMGAVTASAALGGSLWYISNLRRWLRNSPSAYHG